AVVVPTPTATSTAVIVVVTDVPHAERDAPGLALRAQLHLRAGALDVRLQVAAHGLRCAHLDAIAVVPDHVDRPDDVPDDDDERLVGGDGDRLRELARVDDVGADG